MLIVFLFLNSWRSTVITGLTLPVSVISAFLVIYAFGFTLNTMTLMALSLAIGILIDDAIVVRENIVRHVERGEDHYTAARDGTSEIGLAVLATTLLDPRGVRAGRVHGRHRRPVLLRSSASPSPSRCRSRSSSRSRSTRCSPRSGTTRSERATERGPRRPRLERFNQGSSAWASGTAA